jgi:hypothetical protein
LLQIFLEKLIFEVVLAAIGLTRIKRLKLEVFPCCCFQLQINLHSFTNLTKLVEMFSTKLSLKTRQLSFVSKLLFVH